MKNGTSSSIQPKTCFEFMVRSQIALEPYAETLKSTIAPIFLQGIELLVLTEDITSTKHPALESAVELAAKGTGIPKDAIWVFAERTVAFNRPVTI